ncbi:hypothetical protein K461DRAFT_289129 [Myriangium duriaei CBS 260.36]|uniref:Uncharacterized protein n=1 Tax=Myriangium duriaei CBS 260.36 TaxID=1168546 RepID=A0A9P4MP09_9PEZI|nr:hypothetical protein K461DRAFT_289129 [Myriangium duriaei CBS 260.36]
MAPPFTRAPRTSSGQRLRAPVVRPQTTNRPQRTRVVIVSRSLLINGPRYCDDEEDASSHDSEQQLLYLTSNALYECIRRDAAMRRNHIEHLAKRQPKDKEQPSDAQKIHYERESTTLGMPPRVQQLKFAKEPGYTPMETGYTKIANFPQWHEGSGLELGEGGYFLVVPIPNEDEEYEINTMAHEMKLVYEADETKE